MRTKKVKLERHYNKWGYIFFIPFAVGFLAFRFFPLAETFYFAFCYLKHAGNTEPQFLPAIGEPLFKNFMEIFATESFKDAFRNTFEMWLSTAIPELAFTFWLASIVTDRRLNIKGRLLFKTGFFFPKLAQGTQMGMVLSNHMIATVGSTIGFFLIACAMNGFGITEEDVSFFLTGRFFIIVLSIYLHFGITFIYIIAGLTGIPVEVMEAAEMDGANRLQTFFRVTLPCMKPMMFFIAVITIVDGLGTFEAPAIISAPFDIFRENLTLTMFMQNQFYMGSYAYDRASAASLIMLALYAFFAGLVYFIFIRDRYEAKQRKLIRKERREARRAAALR
jgi:multiple sugar transport system permease protein